ncbi:MAG: hypothetical protein AB7G13_11595 [Lautropia sp.]
MAEAKHKPLPWDATELLVRPGEYVIRYQTTRGRIRVDRDGKFDRETAEMVVRAVNSHGALVAALKDVLRIASAASIGITGNQPRLDRARAAIRAATGEAA